MSKYRNALPQLQGSTFLTDAGIETDLIFNHGIEIREFAAHTLLPSDSGRQALANYLRGFLELAKKHDCGLILDSQTWKAHMHWADDLGSSEEEIVAANQQAIAFIAELRGEYDENKNPIVLNGVIGPKGDAYAPESAVAAKDAEQYHAKQLSWLAETDVDMVSGLTFTQSDEAIGLVRAAQKVGLPCAISFTVETDGRLPSGESLAEAIQRVDNETDFGAIYYMVNCAHPDHFFHVLEPSSWTERIRGIRCNASRQSHEELDACEVLDDGDPHELAQQYQALKASLPWINIFGGCCGTDLRHVTQIADAVLT